MNHWWRAYNEAVNDPKLQLISDALFRAWFNLMCIASGNDGALPALKDIAFTLRIAPTKAAQILSQLHAAGLLDKTETGFAPHNWNGRQYKSDVSTERVKRFRKREKNVSSDVTETPPDTESETEDRIGDVRASAFTEGSKVLATSFLKALGFDTPLKVPPEFAGVDWRAIEWERAGWTPDLIDAEARKNAGKPLSYHEKCFATAFAKRQAPLPVVEVREAEKVTVTHGKPRSSIIQAADDLCRKLASFDGPPREAERLRGDASQDPTRLLSHG